MDINFIDHKKAYISILSFLVVVSLVFIFLIAKEKMKKTEKENFGVEQINQEKVDSASQKKEELDRIMKIVEEETASSQNSSPSQEEPLKSTDVEQTKRFDDIEKKNNMKSDVSQGTPPKAGSDEKKAELDSLMNSIKK